MPDVTGYSKIRNSSNNGASSGWALEAAYVDIDWGTYDCTIRPWYSNAVAAPLVAGSCWGEFLDLSAN